jgi:hypothetical protein
LLSGRDGWRSGCKKTVLIGSCRLLFPLLRLQVATIPDGERLFWSSGHAPRRRRLRTARLLAEHGPSLPMLDLCRITPPTARA